MKSLLGKLKRLVLLVLGFFSRVWPDRKALSLTEVATPIKMTFPKTPAATMVFLEPEIKVHSWIMEIQRLLLWVDDQTREICFLAPERPTPEQLRSLEIWLFPEEHPAGIAYQIMDERGRKRRGYLFWLLAPESEWYKAISQRKIKGSRLPENVGRIELWDGEAKRIFFFAPRREWFYPADREAEERDLEEKLSRN